MSIGVYKITCLSNERFYIGSSVDVDRRIRQHRNSLLNNAHYNKHLQRAWDKYGQDSFVFEQILECTLDKLRVSEKWMIDQLKPMFNCSGTDPESNLFHPNAETRRKLSVAHIGNKHALGHRHSDETKATLSSLLVGNKRLLGFKHSDETKELMSKSRVGSNHLAGATHSVEHNENIAKALTGKRRSDETKLKMSESQKKAWIARKEIPTND